MASGSAGRGAALRESMRKALEKKAAKNAAAAAESQGSGCPSAPAAFSGGLNDLDGLDGLDDVPPASGGGGASSSASRGQPAASAAAANHGATAGLSSLDTLDGLDGVETEAAAAAVPRALHAAGTQEEEVDPWPELPLSATPLGVEDGTNRAAQLRRQGDFSGAARMCAKVLHVARRCRPASTPEALAGLQARYAAALVDAGDWPAALRASERALAAIRGSAAQDDSALLAVQARARARMESGDVTGAQADVQDAQERLRACGQSAGNGPCEEAVAAALELEERWRQLQQRPRTAGASTCKLSGDASVDRNQEFFSDLERDWAAACAEDGWDEVLCGRGPEAAAASREQAAGEGVAERGPNGSTIPESSDYFRIQELLRGRQDRELRPEAEKKAYEPKCRRDLSELRRVEAETLQAMEAERARRAAEYTEPIRTRSDVVHLDSLSTDGEDSDEDVEQTAEDAQRAKEAEQAFAAFSEFQRLACEKEERLAKWRGRWG